MMTNCSHKMTEWQCRNCTKCCRQFTLPAKNTAELRRMFREEYGFCLIDPEMTVLFKGTCEHLKDQKCSIYDKRPEKCRDYFCKRYPKEEIPFGQIYKKRCRSCQNIRSFQEGTNRDKQSICGNCWVW